MSEIVKLRIRVPTNGKRQVTKSGNKESQAKHMEAKQKEKKKSHSRYFTNNLEAAYEHAVAAVGNKLVEPVPVSKPNDIYATSFQIRNDTKKTKQLPKKQQKTVIVPMKPKVKTIAEPKVMFAPMRFTIVNDRCK